MLLLLLAAVAFADVVDNGDGTWSYALPVGAAVPADEVPGALTWRYIGQASFPYDTTPAGPQWVVESPETRSTLDLLLQTVRTDAEGRQWQVVAVDIAALEAAIDGYDIRSGEADLSARVPVDEPISKGGVVEEFWWEPSTWHTDTCSTDDIHRWDTDDRSRITGSLTARQQTIVIVDTPAGYCTGVMVDFDNVLTAAHCVTNSSGSTYSLSNYKVCTWGNAYSGAECKVGTGGIQDVIPAANWSGSGTNDDYALIDLPGGWSNHSEEMFISSASDSFIEPIPMHNLGLPAFGPSCSRTTATAVNAGLAYGVFMYHHTADILNLTAERIKTNHDGVGGHSGSPIYDCGDDFCNSGEPGYVTGVWSGYYTDPFSANGHRGPKGSAIRSWVLANHR